MKETRMGWGEEQRPRPPAGGIVGAALRLRLAVRDFLAHPSSNNREVLEAAAAEFDRVAPPARCAT